MTDRSESVETKTDVYRLWQQYNDEYVGSAHNQVVGIPVPGEGALYDIRRGEICRLFPTQMTGAISAYRPATKEELRDIDWHIEHGAFQIERLRLFTLAEFLPGGQTLANRTEDPVWSVNVAPKVLFRANGRKLPSSYEEQSELREDLSAWQRQAEDGAQ